MTKKKVESNADYARRRFAIDPPLDRDNGVYVVSKLTFQGYPIVSVDHFAQWDFGLRLTSGGDLVCILCAPKMQRILYDSLLARVNNRPLIRTRWNQPRHEIVMVAPPKRSPEMMRDVFPILNRWVGDDLSGTHRVYGALVTESARFGAGAARPVEE
jgi:hypothetical protein